jgi:hypothetical protein
VAEALRPEMSLEPVAGPRGVLGRVREVPLPLEAGVLGVGLRAAIG